MSPDGLPGRRAPTAVRARPLAGGAGFDDLDLGPRGFRRAFQGTLVGTGHAGRRAHDREKPSVDDAIAR